METMTVKAVNKAGTGFMAAEHGDQWFNISKGKDITFTGLKKGMRIDVDANDKWVNSFTVAGGTSVPASQAKPTPATETNKGAYNAPDTQDRIARGNASNAVLGSEGLLAYVKEVTGSPAEAIQMTKDLVAEFANYIATGSFKTEAK